jgi:hypothetical protein
MKASWFTVLLVACAGTPAQPTAPSPASPPVVEAPPGPPPTAVAGRIDGDVITVADVDLQLVTTPFEGDPAERAYRLAAQRKRKLEEMLDDRVLLAVAKQRGLAPPEADVDAAVGNVMKVNDLDDEDFTRYLAHQRVTRDAYRASIRDWLTLHLLYREEPGTAEERRTALLARHRSHHTISIELTLPPKPAGLARLIDASKMLVPDDVATLLARSLPAYTVQRLADEPPSATHDSMHFKAKGQPESFDVAYRVWRLSAADLAERWAELVQMPNVVVDKRLGDETLHASQRGIFGTGFLDRSARIIVLVSCGDAVCKTAGDAFAIARLARERLDRLEVTLE